VIPGWVGRQPSSAGQPSASWPKSIRRLPTDRAGDLVLISVNAAWLRPLCAAVALQSAAVWSRRGLPWLAAGKVHGSIARGSTNEEGR